MFDLHISTHESTQESKTILHSFRTKRETAKFMSNVGKKKL